MGRRRTHLLTLGVPAQSVDIDCEVVEQREIPPFNSLYVWPRSAASLLGRFGLNHVFFVPNEGVTERKLSAIHGDRAVS